MSSDSDHKELISRREVILRVSAMLGGVALVGQTAMLAGCAAQPTGEPLRQPFQATNSSPEYEIFCPIVPSHGVMIRSPQTK